MTRETVGTETPANRAIIAMVTFRPFSAPTVRPFVWLEAAVAEGYSQQVGVIP